MQVNVIPCDFRWTIVTATMLIAAAANSLPAQEPLAIKEERAFQQAAASVAASLVRIDTVGGVDRIGNLLASSAPTTGIIVSETGDIITSSFNFAARPSSVLVTLADGRRFPARIVAKDESRMLTLLKIDADGLTPIRPAPPDSVRVGQWAIAVGKTLDGDIPNISVGIVSALGRIWGKAIQTDAKISPVNYGGPLLDIEGRALGVLVPLSPQENVTTAGVQWYDSGIGFAIPLHDVLAVLERLKEGNDQHPGLLGASFKSSGMLDEPIVQQVRFDSPAEQAGLANGDRIIAADGQPVSRMAQLRQVLGRKYAGDEIQLTLRRGEEELNVRAVLTDELRPFVPVWAGILPERLPVPADDAEPEDAAAGVEIRFVWPGSPAGKAGLQEGDRLLKIGDEEIANETAARQRMLRAKAGEALALTIRRGDAEQQLELTPEAAPGAVPESLSSALIPKPPAAADLPETGRIAEQFAQFERDYWAYVPEDYNPDYAYGLVVWLHPPGNTLEATMLRQWQTVCERRGLILLAPKLEGAAAWSPEDTEFVKQLIEDVRTRYTIDPRRIVLHSTAEGAPFAAFAVLREALPATALAVIDTAFRGQIPENSPERPLQFLLLSTQEGEKAEASKSTAEALQQQGYPSVHQPVGPLDSGYLSNDATDTLARWIDSLDWL